MQGTHLAFETHLSFRKMREDLSLLLNSVHICSGSFSKATRGHNSLFKTQWRVHPFFQKLRENSSSHIHQPIGKRAQKIHERIQPIEKRNQSADALAFFENSNETQKHLGTLHKNLKNK